MGLKFIDLFAGIGGMRLAFESAGAECVFSSEIDKQAAVTYACNFHQLPHGDITWCKGEIPPHDILVAGIPCQTFSAIGSREGFKDPRGTLFSHVEKILDTHRPRAVLIENVKNFIHHDEGKTIGTVKDSLWRLGYETHIEVLDSLDFGLPQRRKRTYIVGMRDPGFSFPEPLGAPPKLDTVLEDKADDDPALQVSERIRAKRLRQAEGMDQFEPSIWFENKSQQIYILPFAPTLRANPSHNYLLVNGVRRPSVREMLRFQGFPETFLIDGAYGNARRMTGNAVPVTVVKAIAKRMLEVME